MSGCDKCNSDGDCTGKCLGMDSPIFIHPSLYERAKSEGLDLRGYAKTRRIPLADRGQRLMKCQKELLAAAEALLREIELRPGGYDYRPYYAFRPSSQLNDPDAAVIRLRQAVEKSGGKVPQPL